MTIRSLIETRCGLVNRPVRSPRPRSSASVIRAVDVLPLVPVMWITGQARCGSPSSPTSSVIRSKARSTECSGRREMISRSTSRIRVSISILQPTRPWTHGQDGSGRPARRCSRRAMSDWAAAQALAGLVHDRGGRLGGEVGVSQLPLGLLGLAPGRGEVLLQPAALGGDVDGAGHVELDRDVLGGQRRRSGEAVRGQGEPQQGPDPLLVPGQRRGLDAHEPGGHPLPGPQPLIRAEPPDLGHQRASSRRSPPRRPDRRRRTAGHGATMTDSPPVRAVHSSSVTNGMTGCSRRSS